MTVPILYTFRRCPFAIRARAALYFSKTNYEIREVALKNKPIEMIKASKKATVPILITNEKVIDESIEIILWALMQKDNLNLLIPYKIDKKNTLKSIAKIDNEFKYHLDRYKYSSSFKNDNNFLGKFQHRELALKILLEFEQMLKRSYAYLYGEDISILDICVFPLVRQFRIANIDWFSNHSKLKNLNLWLNRIMNLEFFKIIMIKYKPWEKSQIPQIFSNNTEI